MIENDPNPNPNPNPTTEQNEAPIEEEVEYELHNPIITAVENEPPLHYNLAHPMAENDPTLTLTLTLTLTPEENDLPIQEEEYEPPTPILTAVENEPLAAVNEPVIADVNYDNRICYCDEPIVEGVTNYEELYA
jgi:hypothetical protein